MKKKSFLYAILMMAVMFASCAKDPERHELQMLYPTTAYHYADETSDSLQFLTFDSWRASTDETEWISTVGQSSGDVKYDYYTRLLVTVGVNMQPNLSNVTRRGFVRVVSYKYEGYASFIQYGFLNVTRPEYTAKTYMSEYSSVPRTVEFCLTDSATWLVDSLSFTTQKAWTLTLKNQADSEWITAEQTSGAAGHHLVTLNMTENTSAEERKATFVLSSSDINTEIIVCQLGKKSDDDIEPVPNS